MATTASNPMTPGSVAPDFTLTDTRNQQTVSLSAHANQPVLIVFMCNHCPYVIHLLDELVALAHEAAQSKVATITISANDIDNYPQDAPEKMAELAARLDFQFPYCFDEDQSVAQSYGAVCTPDIFLFDADHKLYYKGQFDETRPNKGKAHGADLRRAIQALLTGKPAPTDTQPSVGCGIKWKH